MGTKKIIGAIAAILLALLARQYLSEPAGGTAYGDRLRIVSLAPSLTEIVFELGGGEQLVGVTNYCTYPQEARTKEKVGDFIHPNVEKIASLKPDLVLAESWTSTKIVSRLRGLGLQVAEILSPRSIAEIYQVIGGVGEATGRQEPAQALIGKMRERIRAIEERGKRFPRRPTVYIEIDLPSWTVGRSSFISEAVYLCGARNLFEDMERPALQVSKEMVIDRNPDIILSFEASASDMRRRPGWDQLEAVRTGRIIHGFDRNPLSHGNHRLVDAMEDLQARLSELMDVGKRPAVSSQQN